MLIQLGMMFVALMEPLNFQEMTSDILSILILVEIFRLLIIYLKEQRISVGAALEVSLVSVLREVILEGALEIPLSDLLGVCAFLGVLGGLLFLQVWMYQQFDDAYPVDGDSGDAMINDNLLSQNLSPQNSRSPQSRLSDARSHCF
jgi:uncharacterized membrane protein (DUF373 family)